MRIIQIAIILSRGYTINTDVQSVTRNGCKYEGHFSREACNSQTVRQFVQMQPATRLIRHTRTLPCSVRMIKSLVSNGSPAGERFAAGLSKLSFWHAFARAIRRSSMHSLRTHTHALTHSTHVYHLATRCVGSRSKEEETDTTRF